MGSDYVDTLCLPREVIDSFGNIRPSANYKSKAFRDPEFETLMLVPSERCNLNCTYCYERHKQSQRMDILTAKTAVRKAFAGLRADQRLKIEFRGGEPFLEFDFISELCDWVIREFTAGRYFFYAITNGTCFTAEAKQWLKEHRDVFVAPVSIDGGRITHNRNRSDSFDSIDFDFILETWKRPRASMTIVPESVSLICQDLRFLTEKGFDIRANFEFDGHWSHDQLKQLTTGFRHFADYALSRHCGNHVNLLSRNSFFEYCPILDENEQKKRGHFLACNAGAHRTLVSADGSVYPCQMLIPSVGNSGSSPSELFDKLKSEELHPLQCRACHFFYLCQICPGYSYRRTGDFKWRNQSFCAITRIRAYLASYFWGLRLINGEMGAGLDEDEVKATKLAVPRLYRGEKVYV